MKRASSAFKAQLADDAQLEPDYFWKQAQAQRKPPRQAGISVLMNHSGWRHKKQSINLRKIFLEHIAQFVIRAFRYVVVGADDYGTIWLKSVCFDTQADNCVATCGEMIL